MFFRLLATLVTADAIDRAARKPPKYWYPDHAHRSAFQPQHALAPPAPPANWYPDPADSAAWRWWDGSNWTEHTAQPNPSALEA
jgi:hypothetical protein